MRANSVRPTSSLGDDGLSWGSSSLKLERDGGKSFVRTSREYWLFILGFSLFRRTVSPLREQSFERNWSRRDPNFPSSPFKIAPVNSSLFFFFFSFVSLALEKGTIDETIFFHGPSDFNSSDLSDAWNHSTMNALVLGSFAFSSFFFNRPCRLNFYSTGFFRYHFEFFLELSNLSLKNLYVWYDGNICIILATF